MAYTIIKNQIFRFTPLSACRCGADFCQLVEGQDEIMLQGTVNAANDIQMVADGDFGASTNWTLGSGWSISGGELHLAGTGGLLSNTSSVAPIGLIAGRTYAIRIKATVATPITPLSGWKVSINGHDIPLNDVTGGYSVSGITATYIYRPSAIGSDNVVFTGTKVNTPDFTVDIEYFEMYEVSEIGVALYDTSGVLITDEGGLSSPNVINYLASNGSFIANNTPTKFEGEYEYNELSIGWQIFIENLDTITSDRGCMYLQIYDLIYGNLTNRIQNGDFATGDLSFWQVGNHWAYNTGTAEYSPPALPYTAGTLCQSFGLLGGNIYTLSFNLQIGVGEFMKVLLDKDDGMGSQVILTTTLGIGARTATIDMTAFTGVKVVTLCFAEDTAEVDFTIDNISVTANANSVGNYSNCINVQDEHACSLITRASNNDNAYGFIYTNTGFRQRMRFYGKIKYNEYPEDAETFVFSDRSRILPYAASDKSFTVTVGDAAEHMHDHLRLARLHDDFRITEKMEDGTTQQVFYVINGGYELGQRKSSSNSTASFNVFEQQGIPANYSCE